MTTLDEAPSVKAGGPNPASLALECARVALGMLSITAAAAGRALEKAAGREVAADQMKRHSPSSSRSPIPGLDPVLDLMRAERRRNEEAAARFMSALLPEITDALMDSLDLTELVIKRVDIDRVVEKVDVEAVVNRVDLDAVATKLDIDAIIDRVDLVGMARYLMDELEVPEIIRESTGALAAESVEQLRVQGIRADRFVSHLLDRIVRRGVERKLAGPTDTGVPPAVAPGSS